MAVRVRSGDGKGAAVQEGRADFSRRGLLAGLGAAGAVTALLPAQGRTRQPGPVPRMRVIIDNDFSGDPDGLFQLAHHVLSPSVEIPLIVGSHLHVADPWDPSLTQAGNGAAAARELLAVMGRAGRYRVLAGADAAIPTRSGWSQSPATAAIVREALREDTDLPLYYAAGAGLTELALAWLAEPRIGRRLRLVWIGGGEHPGFAPPPPGKAVPEYNLTIDLLAAQVIFNESDIEIWQVPRDAYRQMLIGYSELDELAATGATGRYLKSRIDRLLERIAKVPPARRPRLGETYILGDSPLVTLTALQSSFEPDPSSSSHAVLPTPVLDDAGGYRPAPGGRTMRVYTRIDTRLTFADLAAKLRAIPS